MQNSTWASMSPNSASVMRSTVWLLALFTTTPWPGAITKCSGSAGSSETPLTTVHVPVGARQPARSLPSKSWRVLSAAKLKAGARASTAAMIRSWRRGQSAAGIGVLIVIVLQPTLAISGLFGNLFENLLRGGAWVCGGANRAANHQPIGAQSHRFPRGERPLLVIGGSRLGADAGYDELRAGGHHLAHFGHFP